jgi:hypothetical protein
MSSYEYQQELKSKVNSLDFILKKLVSKSDVPNRSFILV